MRTHQLKIFFKVKKAFLGLQHVSTTWWAHRSQFLQNKICMSTTQQNLHLFFLVGQSKPEVTSDAPGCIAPGLLAVVEHFNGPNQLISC